LQDDQLDCERREMSEGQAPFSAAANNNFGRPLPVVG
jgi:hypothetical protein